MNLIGLQKAALEGGLTMLVTPKQLFNSAQEYCKANEIKNVEDFFTDPGDQEHPQAGPSPEGGRPSWRAMASGNHWPGQK